MDIFEEIKTNLKTLTDDQIVTYRKKIAADANVKLEAGDEDLEYFENVKESLSTLDEEKARRVETKQQLDSVKEDILSALEEPEEEKEADTETESEATAETNAEDKDEDEDDVEQEKETDTGTEAEDENPDTGLEIKESVKVGGLVKQTKPAVEKVEEESLRVSASTGKPFESREELRAQLQEAASLMTLGHGKADGEIIKVGKVLLSKNPNVPKLTSDDGARNMELIVESRNQYIEDQEAFVASCCPPADTIRTIQSFGDASTGLVSLPQLNVPRGTVQWALPDASCDFNIETFDWAQECDPNVVRPDKGCQPIPCGTYDSLRVPAFGWCFTYKNEHAMFTPEYLEYRLAQADVSFAWIESNRMLDLILSHPKVAATLDATTASGFGVITDLDETLAVKSWHIRRSLKNSSMRLEALVPSWLRDKGRLDALRRGDSVNSVDAIFARHNINPTYVNHGSALAPGWNELDPTTSKFPTTVEIVLHAPGVFREPVSGDLDFGLQRDSALNAQNEVKIAYEKWTSFGYFGPECAVDRVQIDNLCEIGGIGERIGVTCP